jgi:hypothetical protein
MDARAERVMMRSSNVFWGLVLILGGSLFMADTLDLLGGVDPWKFFIPALLIFLGVAALWSASRSGNRIDEPVAILREAGAGRARLTLSHGAGRLTVKGGAQMGQLADGMATGGVAFTSRMQGDEQIVKASIPSSRIVWFMPPFVWGSRPGFSWDLALAEDIPLDLQVETGASESRLDLSRLKVTNLKVSTGASDTKITFPEAAGLTRAKIECGMASVNIVIPDGVAAHIETSSALGSTAVDTNRFPRSGGAYQSPDFDSAENRIDMRIEMGMGSVTVK